MRNLVINEDQQGGVYNGCGIMATEIPHGCLSCCDSCVLFNADECAPCTPPERKDKRNIIWQHITPQPHPGTIFLEWVLNVCWIEYCSKKGIEGFLNPAHIETRDDIRKAMDVQGER